MPVQKVTVTSERRYDLTIAPSIPSARWCHNWHMTMICMAVEWTLDHEHQQHVGVVSRQGAGVEQQLGRPDGA